VTGWTWNVRDDAWEQGFAYLQNFVEREGHAKVPQRHVEDGYRIGRWVMAQRREYQNGRLAPQRRSRLNATPGWTWTA
jgi:hypothetical protein